MPNSNRHFSAKKTDDLTTEVAAFTGAKIPGKYTNGTPDATLFYRGSDGQVWLKADEATGGIITSFQLENAAGTFVPANFTGPAGGSFGGSLKEATGNVLADTDLTLTGSSGTSGLISLGAVFAMSGRRQGHRRHRCPRRGLRALARAGIQLIVVSADHGHLFADHSNPRGCHPDPAGVRSGSPVLSSLWRSDEVHRVHRTTPDGVKTL